MFKYKKISKRIKNSLGIFQDKRGDMGKIYDDWERIVEAVLRREQLRELAFSHSRNSSTISDESTDLDYSFRECMDSNICYDLVVYDRDWESISDGDSIYDDDTNVDDQKHQVSKLNSDGSEDWKHHVAEQGQTVTCQVEKNENICYTVEAMELLILVRRRLEYLQWTKHSDSRFSKVAVLHYGRWLDIRGRIKSRKLSPKIFYAAYLVFKLTEWSIGFESVNAVVNFFSVAFDRDAQDRAHIVHLQPMKHQWGRSATSRADGWMEVEIGSFYVNEDDEAVEARIFETTEWKMGLIVEGIEFRPRHMTSALLNRDSFQSAATKDDNDHDNHKPIPELSDGEKAPISLDIDVAMDGQDVCVIEKETNKTEEFEIDITLLHKFAQQSLVPMSDPMPSSHISKTLLESPLRQKRPQRLIHQSEASEFNLADNSLDQIAHTFHSETKRFFPDSDLNRDSSSQESGVVEQTSKLLLSQDEPSLASVTSDELFSGGYDCLSKLAYSFYGMKKVVELKEKEIEDLKKKLTKVDVESQLALAAKDTELGEFESIVKNLKDDLEKSHGFAREEIRKAIEKTELIERKLEDVEARATSAVENYKHSQELKVEKHKFASKAFAIGVEFCKKQVLEVDPNFDINCIDVKNLDPPSNAS